jgi:hypothetical protein
MGRHKVLLIVAGVVAMAAAAGIYWFGPQHLFVNERVDEALPTATSEDGRGAIPGETAGDVMGRSGDDDAEPAAPIVLATGRFRSLAHETRGTASILELEDGSRFLRIEDLDTSSGPDVRVYLSEAPADASDDAFDDAIVDLGGVKGNQGDQNYEIPTGVDLSDFESVSIWCRRFSVGFGVAPLPAPA